MLKKIWDSNPAFSQKFEERKLPAIEIILGDFFAIGPYYYYVLDCVSGTISGHHENILSIHGFSEYPQYLDNIIQLMHPDDLPFVMSAEEMCYKKINEIGNEHLIDLKSSYCFRMKTAEDKYEMFHHQAIHTAQDETEQSCNQLIFIPIYSISRESTLIQPW
ncbi:MAG: hypothetical protein Q4F57_01095 [Weeksellaceae bacterium]|nr:hypothetical protein [Weeksellaceae bacterium]